MRQLLLALLGLSALLLVWFLRANTGESGSDAARGPAAAGAAQAAAAEQLARGADAAVAETARLEAAAVDTRRSQVDVDAPAEGRTDADAASSAGVLVRVVRAEDGTPIEDAEVYAQAGSAFLEEDVMALFAGALTMDEILTRDAVVRFTDAAGLVRIDAPAMGTLLRGRKDDRTGLMELRPDTEEPVVLELSTARSLRVEVRQADDSPAAQFPLDLRLEQMTLFRVFTGQDGFADLSPALELTAQMFSDFGSTLRIRAGAPLVEPPQLEVDIEALPDEAPLLRLPPMGRVRVALTGVDPDGPRPVVRVSIAPEDFDPAHAQPSPNPMDGLVGLWSPEQPLEFPVGLGVRTVVTAWQRFDPDVPHALLAGLRYAGEVVETELDVSTREALGRFRIVELVDGEQVPWREEPIAMATRGATTFAANLGNHRTNAAGFLELRLPDEAAGGVLVASTTAVGIEPLSGTLAIPERPRSGTNELGDLVLEPAPVLAAGHVLEADGRSIAGAIVYLVRRAEGYDPRIAQPIRSDSTGHFAFRGPAEEGELGVQASRSMAAEPGDVHFFTAGDESLELVLPAVAQVLVEIDAPAHVLATLEELESLALQPRGDRRARGRQAELVEPSAGGELARFRFPDVSFGAYSLVLRLPGLEQEHAPLEHVTVDAEGELDLGTVSLRGRIFAHTLTVIDADGAPVKEASVTMRAAGAEAFSPHSIHFDTGAQKVLSSTPRIDVLAHALGNQLADGIELNAAAEIVVRIEPPEILHVQIPVELVEARGSSSLSACLAIRGGRNRAKAVDEAGRASLWLTTLARVPGAELEVFVFARKSGQGIVELGGTRTPFKFSPGQSGQRLEIRLSDEALARALEELRGADR